MNFDKPFIKIDKSIDMPALEIGQKIIRPVACMTGWRTKSNTDSGAGAALRLTPTEIVVQEGQDTYSVSIPELPREPLQKLLFSGAAVTAICLFVMLVSRGIAKRRAKPE